MNSREVTETSLSISQRYGSRVIVASSIESSTFAGFCGSGEGSPVTNCTFPILVKQTTSILPT